MKKTFTTLAFMLILSSVTITAQAATKLSTGDKSLIDNLDLNSNVITNEPTEKLSALLTTDKLIERRKRRKKCPNC